MTICASHTLLSPSITVGDFAYGPTASISGGRLPTWKNTGSKASFFS